MIVHQFLLSRRTSVEIVENVHGQMQIRLKRANIEWFLPTDTYNIVKDHSFEKDTTLCFLDDETVSFVNGFLIFRTGKQSFALSEKEWKTFKSECIEQRFPKLSYLICDHPKRCTECCW